MQEINLIEFDEREMQKRLATGLLDRNWASNIMKTVWGEDLASRLNDNQNKK